MRGVFLDGLRDGLDARPVGPEVRVGELHVGASLFSLHRREHFVHVAVYFNLEPNAADRAFLVDQEGAADDAHRFLAVAFFLLPGAVRFADFVVFIGDQRKLQSEFFSERAVTFHAVGRDPHDGRTGRLQASQVLLERLRFPRSAGRVVSRVEIQDQLAAVEVFQRHVLAALVLSRERGRWVVCLQHRI